LLPIGGRASPRVPAGLPGAGRSGARPEKGLFIAVADLPLDKYNESAISSGLANPIGSRASRLARSRRRVVRRAKAVLAMKLFTIFKSDERAFEHVRSQRARIAALVKACRESAGVGYPGSARSHARRAATKASTAAARTGASYLAQKKAQRDGAKELASRARDTVAAVFDRLAARASDAKRRSASELPAQGGPLLLDAAFLVPRARAAAFKTLAARESKALARHGYGLTLSGPWPPYTFVQD